jgi:hypothetical protein
MGLDTSHDCWHGAYSAFMRWREKLTEIAGYGDLGECEGFGGNIAWPLGDPLVGLLTHSDCDGEIPAALCAPIADRLEQLMPALKVAGEAGGHIGNYAEKTQLFIDGLRAAAAANEPVEFH